MLTVDQVMSVYSGKDGACCCGCSGKHYYNSQYVEEGSKNRGYEVRPEEVNDRMVGKVVRIMNDPNISVYLEDETYISKVIGSRLYVAYYLPKVKEEESKKEKKWDGSTDSNSKYYVLRQYGLSHDEAIAMIEN